MAGKAKYLLVIMLIALFLGGCAGTGTEEAEGQKEYQIYYTNLAGTRLEAQSYVPTSDRFDGILTELLDEFQSPSYSDVSSAMPLGVEVNGYTMGVDDLQVDFNAAYLGLSNVQEVLLRAGLAKTLLQLPGVARVRITVDGQPLTDSDGREVAAMNEDTFIDNQGNGINSYHYLTLNLYFSNGTGDKVVREVRSVFYSSNLIMEKIIVEQIIKGPANERLLAVADPSVLVKSVKISRNICVIDLDSKFNNDPSGGTVDPETCLYAFVNAICDACEVEGVQFRIDGESEVRFRGQVNLDQTFYRNADIIEASGSSEPMAEIFLDEEGSETEAVAVSQSGEAVNGASAETTASGTILGENSSAGTSTAETSSDGGTSSGSTDSSGVANAADTAVAGAAAAGAASGTSSSGAAASGAGSGGAASGTGSGGTSSGTGSGGAASGTGSSGTGSGASSGGASSGTGSGGASSGTSSAGASSGTSATGAASADAASSGGTAAEAAESGSSSGAASAAGGQTAETTAPTGITSSSGSQGTTGNSGVGVDPALVEGQE